MMLSLNLHRRHLSESQRAMVAGKIANLQDGQRADQAASIDAPAITQSVAAEMLNVGRASVQRAREVIESGSPLLERAVEQKLADQEDFVNWWRESVRGKGKKANSQDRRYFVDSAEELTGITKQQVSKWAKRLQDREKYRAQLFGVGGVA